MGEPVGKLAALWRYPVKSMAAEPLERVEVSWHGLAGDRRFAFVRAGMERSGFPWMTIRERSDMWGFRPRFEEPARPDDSRVLVSTPAGRELDVVDPALAAELEEGSRVIKQGRGNFDSSPLSLITTQTIAALGERAGRELEPERFRPNLLVQAASCEPYQEDAWVGAELEIGGMTMRVDRRDERCVITTVDPVTAERDPGVLRAIATEREACLGVYGAPVRPGAAAVGDTVTIRT